MTSQVRFPSFAVLRGSLVLSLALLLLGGSVPTAEAQLASRADAAPASRADAAPTFYPGETMYPTWNPIWKANFAGQLASLLESPNASMREDGLQHIVFFSAVYGKDIDMKGTVPGLKRIYESDANELHRILALTALLAIDDVGARKYLSKSGTIAEDLLHVNENSPRVREMVTTDHSEHLKKFNKTVQADRKARVEL